MKKLGIVGVLLLAVACSGKQAAFSGDGTVAATLNGEKITIAELDESVKSQRQRIDMELYELRKDGLDNLIDQKLLEQAAKAKGVSTDELIKAEIESKISPPTDEELQNLYNSRKQKDSKPFAELKDDIRQYMMQNKSGMVRRSFLASLRQAAKIETHLSAPRIEVAEAGNPALGPKNAPVTVIEFTDYQCPFCGRSRATINQILDTYPDKVRYVLRDFPLSFHKDSFLAHEAAHCAGDQDKYWDYNKKLFGNQSALKEPELKNYAKEVGLNMKKFEGCLSDHKYAELVQKNLDDGQQAGVSGTPAFFVNGILISGARPFPDFKQVIDDELAKQ